MNRIVARLCTSVFDFPSFHQSIRQSNRWGTEHFYPGADPDIRNIRTGECQILSLKYYIANSRLHKVTTSLLLI